jgi:hypothetical protein
VRVRRARVKRDMLPPCPSRAKARRSLSSSSTMPLFAIRLMLPPDPAPDSTWVFMLLSFLRRMMGEVMLISPPEVFSARVWMLELLRMRRSLRLIAIEPAFPWPEFNALISPPSEILMTGVDMEIVPPLPIASVGKTNFKNSA